MASMLPVAIGGLVVGGLVFAVMKSSKAAETKPDPKGLGTKDGCAAGKADATSGLMVSNPFDLGSDKKLADAASASGDAVAYMTAYQSAYDSCYKEAKPVVKDTGGSTTTTPKPPPMTATGPLITTPGLNFAQMRINSMLAWNRGCYDGLDTGFSAGYNEGLTATRSPSTSKANATDNPEAYKAGFRKSFPDGRIAGWTSSHIGGATSYSEYDAGDRSHKAVQCTNGFDAWYSTHEDTAKKVYYAAAATTKGVDVSARSGWERALGKVQVAGVALVGARGMPRVAQCVGRRAGGWPMPPADEATTIYRSY